jgi:Spy/CpxP family protein refolding chaperone
VKSTLLPAALTLVGCLALIAKDPRAAAQEKEAKDKPSKKRSEPRGRLPNYWSKLDISAEQKERIYAAQRRAREKIEPLRKQIEVIEARLDEEMLGVLTPQQRQRLEQIEVEAKAQREAKRKGGGRKAAESQDSPSTGKKDNP